MWLPARWRQWPRCTLVTAPEQRLGAFGLAEVGDPLAALAELARRGVKAAVFEGSPVASRAVP